MKPRKPSLEIILGGLPPKAGVLEPLTPRNSFGDWGSSELCARFFSPFALVCLLTGFGMTVLCSEAFAQLNGATKPAIIPTLIKWLPLILFGSFNIKLASGFPWIVTEGELGGFALNLAVSFLVMGLATVFGVFLGMMQLSSQRVVREPAWAVTLFFRNSPWLVLLFFTILLTPFQITVFGVKIPIPDWFKAVIGLTLPVMANVAELTRGAILSIPSGQWDSSESLGFTYSQTLRLIIMPQCVKRMTPPWMNWYAILTQATSLISIVGVTDAMTLTQNA